MAVIEGATSDSSTVEADPQKSLNMSLSDASHMLAPAEEADTTARSKACSSESPVPCPISVGESQPTGRRSSRLKIFDAKPAAFRKVGTKDSIDRSTCSTTVGSSQGDSTMSGRLQVSDLSVHSRRSEGSETNTSCSTAERLHDKPAEHQAPLLPDDESLGELSRSTSSSFNDSDLTFKTCPTYPSSETGEDNCDETPSNSQFNYETDDCDNVSDKNGGDSSTSNNDIAFDAGSASSQAGSRHVREGIDGSSSSDNEIAFDCDSSSSEVASLSILDSSRRFDSGSNQELGLRRSNTTPKAPIISHASQTAVIKKINAIRLVCGQIVNHPHVQNFIVFLIILNSLQMGLGTFDFVESNPRTEMIFEKLDNAFLIVFTVESGLQLVFYGINLFRDSWLTFDFAVIVLSWVFSSLQVIRALRTLRLVGRVKILRKLCEALVEAVPRLSGILFLFLLIMYIYAVMATVLFGDMWERGLTSDNYFSRLDVTLFTLFQMVTLDWASIVREVMKVYPLSAVVFCTYLSFTSFILFSLIIGVVCDAVRSIEHDASLIERMEQKEQTQERILRLQHQVDYLKKQQKSVLARVQTVLDEIMEKERISHRTLPANRRSLDPSQEGSSSDLVGRGALQRPVTPPSETCQQYG